MLPELIIFLLIYINEKTYRMFKMYSLLHMYICALQICTPLYLFFKFVTEKILKTGGDLPAN